jgi:hypothetical protein
MGHKLVVVKGSFLLLACGDGASAPPDAEPAPDAIAAPDAAACGTPVTVFLNGGGGTYTSGMDNSSTNTSSILNMERTLAPYAGTISLDDVRACVASLLAPFNVVVTTTDPGDAVHRELVFIGAPAEIGAPEQALSISPIDCATDGEDPLPRVIAFVMGGQYDDATLLCEDTAQVVGHTFGLDHAFQCDDVMAWDPNCGARTFLDMDVPCGETEARGCACGATQNSYQQLADLAGLACD